MNVLTVRPTRRETVMGLCFLPLYSLVLPTLIGAVLRSLGLGGDSALLNFVYYCVCLTLCLLLFRRLLLASVRHFLKRPFYGLLTAFGGYLLYYFGTTLVGVLIASLDASFQNANNSAIAGLVAQRPAAALFLCIVCAPVVEECLFRGVVFGSLHSRSRFFAYAVTALLFGALHVFSYLNTQPILTSVFSVLQYVPASLALCLVYEKTGTLLTPILTHSLVNLISCCFYLGT